MKAHTNLRLDTKLNSQLDQVARDYDFIESSILKTALQRSLDPETKQSLEGFLLYRLDRSDALLGSMKRCLSRC